MTQVERQLIKLVRETLALDEATAVAGSNLLFYDLDFTSMDFLDLLFRIEDEFGVPVPEGTLYSMARGDLDDSVFSCDGVLTENGRARLMALLSDSPSEIFPERIDSQTVHRYCTVGAFARLIEYLQEKAE